MRCSGLGGLVALSILAGACSTSADPVLVETTAIPSEAGAAAASSSATSDQPAAGPGTATAGDVVDEADAGPVPAALARVEVLERRGHDPSAFTQGLVFHEGRLFESRGLYGESALTEIDPVTGEVLRRVDNAPTVFAEGLALVDDRLIQLTWRAEEAYVYDLETFERIGTFRYTGEGWGLCHDGRDLWMSNGTATLTRRSSETFEALEEVTVQLGGRALDQLNELECIDGFVWANVWLTDLIVVIDPATGQVVSQIDAGGLLSPAELQGGADVLNGIARDDVTGDLVITGKRWPAMFVVDIVS